MYILTIHYPRSDGATFDFDYFKSTHLPEVGKAFKPFGLGYASVLRGKEGLDGGEPAYFATTILSFADEEALVLLNGSGDRRFLTRHRPLAEADQPLVRVDLAEHPIETAGVHREGLDARDLEVQRFRLRE